MSDLRQRKSTTSNDVNKQDSPQSDSSWEKNLDTSRREADDDNNDDEGKSLITQQPTLEESPTPIPAPIPNKLDKFLSTYGSFSASTFTADQGIKILQWSSWVISYATSKSKQYPNLSPALQDISFEFSFARYILRFYGFFQSLEGYRSGSWAGGSWDNPQIAKIAKYLMCGSMLAYYPLEHLAYAGWKIPKLVKVNANKMSAISCVFWTTYIIGDFWTSHLKWKELKDKLSKIEEVLMGKKRDDIDEEHVDELLQAESILIKKIRLIKLQLARCILFILPAINWSLPNWATNPLLGELPLNGLMLAEAYTSVYQSLVSMCT